MKTAQKNNRTLETIQERLLKNKETRGIRYSLEPIIDASTKLNSPHLNLPYSIQIAGTNGKGSTCAHIEAVLRYNGFKVGIYTSPHLIHFNERIKVNGHSITDDEIVYFLDNALDKIKEIEFLKVCLLEVAGE